MDEKKFQKSVELAYSLVSQVRAEALVSLRFLDVALYKLKLRFDLNTTIYTDGEYIVMNPYYIFNLYKSEDNLLLRNYLHIILHCIFFHLFVSKNVDEKIWNLSCDIACENIINELKLPTLIKDYENPQIGEINILKQAVGDLTAEKIYNYFMTYGINEEYYNRLKELFYRDDHSIWFYTLDKIGKGNEENNDNEDVGYKEQNKKDENNLDNKEHENNNDKEKDVNNNDNENIENNTEEMKDEDDSGDEASNIDGDKNKSDKGEEENQNADSTNKSDINNDSDNEEEREGGKSVDRTLEAKNENTKLDDKEGRALQEKINDRIGNNENEKLTNNSENRTDKIHDDNYESRNKLSIDIENATYNDWKNISERTKEDLMTFSNEWGNKSNSLRQYILEVNREKYDYEDFLRSFAIAGENIEINDEEFDLIYYTYGLKTYENVPLVEPLEYKEVNKIKEFVIAIDVSGSVKGDIVKKFIEKTYNILLQRENFFNKVNIHIVLCDTEIKNDYTITTLDELNSLIDNIVLEGFGGTDFRPVFKYVNELKMKGDLKNIKGLIYFTDGLGEYPTKMPEYETAFVFLKNEYDKNKSQIKVPSWAIKLILEEL